MVKSLGCLRRTRKVSAVIILTAFFVNMVALPGYSAGNNLRPVATKQTSKRLNDLDQDIRTGRTPLSRDGGSDERFINTVDVPEDISTDRVSVFEFLQQQNPSATVEIIKINEHTFDWSANQGNTNYLDQILKFQGSVTYRILDSNVNARIEAVINTIRNAGTDINAHQENEDILYSLVVKNPETAWDIFSAYTDPKNQIILGEALLKAHYLLKVNYLEKAVIDEENILRSVNVNVSSDVDHAIANIERFESHLEDNEQISRKRRLEILKKLKDALHGIPDQNKYPGYVDHHVHTFMSDGQYSPAYVVFDAWRNGMQRIGVVDHNTFRHYEEAVKAGEILGIQVVPGTEFDVSFDMGGWKTEYSHVVGYFPGINSENLEKNLRMLGNLRSETENRRLINNAKLEMIRQRFNDGSLTKSKKWYLPATEFWVTFGQSHMNWTNLWRVTKEIYSSEVVESEPGLFADKYGRKKREDPKYPNMVLIENPIVINEKTEDVIGPVNANKLMQARFNQDFSQSASLVIAAVHALAGKVVLAHPIEERNVGKATQDQYKKLLKATKKLKSSDHSYTDEWEKVWNLLVNNIEPILQALDFDGIEISSSKQNSFIRAKLGGFVSEINKKKTGNKPFIRDSIASDAHYNDYEEGKIYLAVGEDNNGNNLDAVQKQHLNSNDFIFDGAAEKVKVAVIGGTGNIGLPIVNRLKQKGEVEVLVGSRKADPERGIMKNEDASALADIVLVTVPAQVFRTTIEQIAPVMKPGTTLVSFAVPMGKVGDKLGYVAPEGYNSAAEEVAAIINQKAPGKDIKVVAALHNVPAEWHADPFLTLDQEVVVLGDDQKACSLVCENVVRQISDLKPVIAGGLEKSRYSEALTPRIIASQKELLAPGSRPLSELVAFMEKHGVNVETAKILAFNREKLDPALMKIYQDNAKLQKDIKAILDSRTSVRQKEYIGVALARYSQIIPVESSMAATIKAAVNFYRLSVPDHKMFGRDASGFDAVVDEAASVKNVQGAIVVGAQTILENAGALTSLLKVKESGANIKIAVWTENAETLDRLKAIGIETVADVMSANGAPDVLARLADANVPATRIVLLHSDADQSNFIDGFDSLKDFYKKFGKVKIVHVNPGSIGRGQAKLNAMPLAVLRAVAAIFNDQDAVKQKFTVFAQGFLDNQKISAYDFQMLTDLTKDIVDVPLVTVEEEVLKIQKAYEAVLSRV